jgi:hypothetical protein
VAGAAALGDGCDLGYVDWFLLAHLVTAYLSGGRVKKGSRLRGRVLGFDAEYYPWL